MDEFKEVNMADKESGEGVRQKQVEFIKDTFKNNVPVRLYGGYAEEALLNSSVTRSHHDVDMVVLRKDGDDVKLALENIGCNVQECTEEGGEKPYKFLVKKDEVEADIAFLDWDEERGQPYADTKTTDGKKVRVYFDKEGFGQQPQNLGNLSVETVSPLMQMQMREAFWLVKRGKPRQQDLEKQEELRQKFFPNEESGSGKFKPELTEVH